MLRTLLLCFLSLGVLHADSLVTVPTDGVRLMERNGYLLVDVKVNGGGPWLFLLDTGATSSAVTPTLARQAGIVTGRSVLLTTTGGDVSVPRAEASLEVEFAKAIGAEVLVLSLEAPKALDPRIEGVLGRSFLALFPHLIDYRGHRLWLGDEATRRAEDLPERHVAGRLGGRLTLDAQLEPGASPLKLVLDSGTPELVLSCGARCPPGLRRDTGELRTNAGFRTALRGSLARVRVGGREFCSVAAVLVEGAPVTPGGDGLLPTRWFSAIYFGPENTVAFSR